MLKKSLLVLLAAGLSGLMLFVAGCGELGNKATNSAEEQVRTVMGPELSDTLLVDGKSRGEQTPLAAGVATWPRSMRDFKWPWLGVYNACGGEMWYIYAGYYRTGGSSYHTGRDLYAVDLHRVGEGSLGRWVLAPARGRIKEVGRNPYHPYGYYVKMDHGNGYESLVAHLRYNPTYLEPGDDLLQGTFLGYCGSTGNSSGAHIHFRITRYGHPQPLTGISGYSNIVKRGRYWSGNAYKSPPRGFRP